LFSYEHALAYLVNDCNLTEELAEQVLDQFNDKTGKYSWEEIAEGIRTGRIKFSGNMDIDCDESYKRASLIRSNVRVTDRFGGSVPDPFGSFYPDKQDTPVPSAFDESRASGSYKNIPQTVVDNPELARLWLFTEAVDGLWRSTTAAMLASASGQERNRQKADEQVAKKPPIPEKLYRKGTPASDKSLTPRTHLNETSVSFESKLANPLEFRDSPLFPSTKPWFEIETRLLPKQGQELIFYGDRPTHWGMPPEVTPQLIREAVTLKSTGSGMFPK
jgi:hypothetical protein